MGRVFDFAKRRIAGYIVFWILVLLFVGIFYNGDPPAQAAGLFVLFLAFVGSLLYTRRMNENNGSAENPLSPWSAANDPPSDTGSATCLPPASGGALSRS